MATIKFTLSAKGGKDNDRPELLVSFTDGTAGNRVRIQSKTGLLAFRDYWSDTQQKHPLTKSTKINPLIRPEVIAINKKLADLKTMIESIAPDTPTSEMGRAWLAAIVEDVLHPTKQENEQQSGPKTLMQAVADFIAAAPTRVPDPGHHGHHGPQDRKILHDLYQGQRERERITIEETIHGTMEMINKQNDMEINAAILKTRELLEEIPDVKSIIGAWDVYCAHMDGPTIQVGPSFDDVINNPNPQDQRIGLQILVGIYNRLAPFEDRIVSLFKILDFAQLSMLDHIVRNKLSFLNRYCGEFHTYQTTIMALGLLDNQEQQRKQPKRPKKQIKAIKDCMLFQEDEKKVELLKVLHALIEDKIGKWPALVIAVSVRMGLLIKPKYKMLVAEFGYIGAESGFNRQYKNGLKAFENPIKFGFSKDEIDTIKRKLSCFVVPGSSDK